jgi:hypothetical protein
MTSKYEELREVNIRRNQDFLQSLGIDLVAPKNKSVKISKYDRLRQSLCIPERLVVGAPLSSKKRHTSAPPSADKCTTRRKSARLERVESVSLDTCGDIKSTAARVVDEDKVPIVRKRITAEVCQFLYYFSHSLYTIDLHSMT